MIHDIWAIHKTKGRCACAISTAGANRFNRSPVHKVQLCSYINSMGSLGQKGHNLFWFATGFFLQSMIPCTNMHKLKVQGWKLGADNCPVIPPPDTGPWRWTARKASVCTVFAAFSARFLGCPVFVKHRCPLLKTSRVHVLYGLNSWSGHVSVLIGEQMQKVR